MVVHAYYPLGETRVEREAQALLTEGWEVDVICLQDEGEPSIEEVDNVMVYRLPVRRSGKGFLQQLLEYFTFFFLAFGKLTSLHLKKKYQTVQLHNLPDFLVFAGMVPKLTGSRLILDLHDLMPEFFAARFNRSINSLPVRLVKLQEKLSCLFADHVITVTELWRQTLIQRGVPAHKVSVVMNVADEHIFRRTASRPLDEHAFHLIYHGSIVYRYGIDLVIRAIHLLHKEIPDLHLTIHGKGDFLEELRAMSEQLGLNDCVHFSTQFVPTSELPRLIERAHLGVVPYRRDIFTDGILPTKMMEYVALGVPVLAAKTAAISAYFDDSMVEFFTAEDVEDLARKIKLLYNDRERLASLAKNAEKFIQQYSWANVAAGYVKLVASLH
jgi:glycosyltransferase involved in cell wall biosynthesis